MLLNFFYYLGKAKLKLIIGIFIYSKEISKLNHKKLKIKANKDN